MASDIFDLITDSIPVLTVVALALAFFYMVYASR